MAADRINPQEVQSERNVASDGATDKLSAEVKLETEPTSAVSENGGVNDTVLAQFPEVELVGNIEPTAESPGGEDAVKPENERHSKTGWFQERQDYFVEQMNSKDFAENFERMASDGTLDRDLGFMDPSALHSVARRFADLPSQYHARAEQALRDVDPMWATQMKLAVAGVPDRAADFDPTKYEDLRNTGRPTDRWTGSGITGINPSDVGIALGDQFNMFTDHLDWTSNGAAEVYKRFTPREEMRFPDVSNLEPQQAFEAMDEHQQNVGLIEQRFVNLFLEQPISTTTPEAYDGKIPSRADVIMAAGKMHGVDPRILAGFMLTEQREQSQNEDALDYHGATYPIVNRNTSIGLPQIQVDNARADGGALLSGTVDSDSRADLSRPEAADYLVSDEHSIFAAAKFIRDLANRGARIFENPDRLPETRKLFPHMDYAALGKDSSHWDADHVGLLAAEYTSSPWDDDIKASSTGTTYWGREVVRFTNMAYKADVFR